MNRCYYALIIACSLALGLFAACGDDDSSKKKSVSGEVSAPEKVYASDGECASGVLVSWEKGSGAESYRVLRRGSPSGEPVVLGSTAHLFYRDESATAGTTYYYSIISIGNGENSSESVQDEGSRSVVSSSLAWTVMIYLDGDNNLETYAVDDLKEMQLGFAQAVAGGNDNIDSRVNLIVLFDGWDDEEHTEWESTLLYHITSSGATLLSGSGYFTEDLSSGEAELNMGDPDTLADFIHFCMDQPQYAADHYALILWNHGQGVRGSGGTDSSATGKSVCQDDESSDCLYIDEIQDALTRDNHFSSSSKLDIIAFDACLMGMVEVAYEFRDLADYMVASMAIVQGKGWDYTSLFGSLTGSLDESGLTPADMSYHMVDTYRQFISDNYSNSGETMAAVRLSQLQVLKDNIDILAVNINDYEDYTHITTDNSASNIETIRDNSIHFYTTELDSRDYPYYNLYDFCNRLVNSNYTSGITQAAGDVIASLDSALFWAYGDSSLIYKSTAYAGAGATAHQGLSILFSRGNRNYSDTSYYLYNAWYTSFDLWGYGYGNYGNIDFCTYDDDGDVETWLELHEAWYDPGDQTYSSY